MKHLYTLLFSLSIILINPWGTMRGEIWTQPKVFAILLICILNFLMLWSERDALTIPRNWKISKLLWEIFLGIGLLSTLTSPFPLRSLFGQEQMGDGLLYWLLIAIFTLSNALLLRLHPELVRSQLQGLVIGGVILAISIFPQVINWRIDYTATTGQLMRDNILQSTIFQGQQPIGLYSHRGHASFVLAASAVMTLVGWRSQWINTRYAAIASVLIIPALFATNTRAGLLALIVAVTYLLGRKHYKFLLPAVLACLLIIGITTTTRQIDNLPLIKQITSDRVYLWQLSNRGISSRPLLGWGFDGFGAAYPQARYHQSLLKVTRLSDFDFDYKDKNGRLQTAQLPTTKAHNLILDTTLSVGFLGMLSYITLLGFCLWQVVNSPYRGIEAVAIAYFAFTFTWFESAQFTHLVWWSLSLKQAIPQKLNHLNSDSLFSVSTASEKEEVKEAAGTIASRRFNKKTLQFLLLAIGLTSLIGTYYLGNLNNIKLNNINNIKFESSKSSLSSLSCGTPSKGPTDNPITKKYNSDAYAWTNNIRWQCVYNINDFKGDTLIERFNLARDAAAAAGGGVVYFPAGTYYFNDNIYLKSGVVIRGETPKISNATSEYNPPTKLEFPKYEPLFLGSGIDNSTAFKKIFTSNPDIDSNIGIVNVDINRAGVYIVGNIDRGSNQNIIVYGIRSNNVADPSPFVPNPEFQSGWLRYSYLFAANIKINAFANVLVSNNRLNDAITDNYSQPNYQVISLDNSIISYLSGSKVPFDYANHYGIVVNRAKVEGAELEFKLSADPTTEPGLFRKGIAIRDNWIYHTMRAGIRAAGDNLVIQDNEIKDKPNKQWWTDPSGTGQPVKNVTYENRAIDWAGWNVLIQGNHYEVYRHQLMDSKDFSVDGEGILIQECCGGTKINQVTIQNNSGNSYIGIYKAPFIRDVQILGNKLLSNVTNTALIYVNADTNNSRHTMHNVRIENNIVNGSVQVQASLGGSGNIIRNNVGNHKASIKYSCSVAVVGNKNFSLKQCLKTKIST